MQESTGRDVDLVTISLLCVDSRSTQIVIPRLIPAHALVTLAACAFQLEESRVRLIWRGQAIDAKRDLKDYVSDDESQIAIHVVYKRPPESSSEGLTATPVADESSGAPGTSSPPEVSTENAGDASNHGITELRVGAIQIGIDNPLRSVVRMPYEATSSGLPTWLNAFARAFSEDGTRRGVTGIQQVSTGPAVRTLSRQQNEASTSALANLRQLIETFQRDGSQNLATAETTEATAQQQDANSQILQGVAAAVETAAQLQETSSQQDRSQGELNRQSNEQTVTETARPEHTTAATDVTSRESSTDQTTQQRSLGEPRSQSSVAGMLTNVILGEVERFLQQQGLETSDSLSMSDLASVIAININDARDTSRDTQQTQTAPSRTVSSQAQPPERIRSTIEPQPMTASSLFQGRRIEGATSRPERVLRQTTGNTARTSFQPHILLRRPHSVSSMHVVETPTGVVTLQTSPPNIIDDLFRRLSVEFSRISEYINCSSRLLSNARNLGFCSLNNQRQRQQQQERDVISAPVASAELSHSARERRPSSVVESSSVLTSENVQQRSERISMQSNSATSNAVSGEINLPTSFPIRNNGFISDADLSTLLNWVALDEAAECAEQVTGWRCFLFTSRAAREAHRMSPLTLYLRSFQQSNHAMMSLLTQLAAWQEGFADFGTLDLVDTVIMATRISTLLANLSFVLVCILFHLASRFDYASFFRFMMNHRLLLRTHRGENGNEDVPSEINEEEFQDAQESPRANPQQQEAVSENTNQTAVTQAAEALVDRQDSDQQANSLNVTHNNVLPEEITQLITQSLSQDVSSSNQAISNFNTDIADEETEIALSESIDRAIRFVSDLSPQILAECSAETLNTENVSSDPITQEQHVTANQANEENVNSCNFSTEGKKTSNTEKSTDFKAKKPTTDADFNLQEITEISKKLNETPDDTIEALKETSKILDMGESVFDFCATSPSMHSNNNNKEKASQSSIENCKEDVAAPSPNTNLSSSCSHHQESDVTGVSSLQRNTTTGVNGVDCHNTRGTRLLGSTQESSTKKPRLLSTSSLTENQSLLKDNVNSSSSTSGTTKRNNNFNTNSLEKVLDSNAKPLTISTNKSETQKHPDKQTITLQEVDDSDVPTLIRDRFSLWTRDPQRFSRLVLPLARQPPFSNSYRSGDVHAPMRIIECKQVPSIEPMFALRWRDAASRVNIPNEFAEPPPETALMVPYIKMTLKDLAAQAKNHPDYFESKFSCLDRIISLFYETTEKVHK